MSLSRSGVVSSLTGATSGAEQEAATRVTAIPTLTHVVRVDIEIREPIELGHETMPPMTASPSRRAAAFGVHVFTASGVVWALLAVLAISEHRFRGAFFWMGAALAVDMVDGALARLVDVKRVFPRFDGALLDNLVDYLTYVLVPAYLIVEADLLPSSAALATVSAFSVASAYQFCQADAKTSDHYFKGFPSYWNAIAFYLFVLGLDRQVNLVVLLLLTAAIFVPIKYIYPSRTVRHRPFNLGLGALWSLSVGVVAWRLPAESHGWTGIALACSGVYALLSVYHQFSE